MKVILDFTTESYENLEYNNALGLNLFILFFFIVLFCLIFYLYLFWQTKNLYEKLKINQNGKKLFIVWLIFCISYVLVFCVNMFFHYNYFFDWNCLTYTVTDDIN